MAHEVPAFETQDIGGDTLHFNGNVGTSPVAIPSVAGLRIQEIIVDNRNIAPNKDLLISFDGGTNFKTIGGGEALRWLVYGGLTQILLKGSDATTPYEILMNRVP